MREIKFRAWDKERKDMRQVNLMDWSDWWVSTGSTWQRGNALEYGERNSFNNEETDRHILMQYTGLKDKNGKEIYEGDISEGDNAIYLIQWDANMAQYKAKILTTKSVLSKNLSFPLWQYVEDEGSCRFEVIGNIYENPEQMEK